MAPPSCSSERQVSPERPFIHSTMLAVSGHFFVHRPLEEEGRAERRMRSEGGGGEENSLRTQGSARKGRVAEQGRAQGVSTHQVSMQQRSLRL